MLIYQTQPLTPGGIIILTGSSGTNLTLWPCPAELPFPRAG